MAFVRCSGAAIKPYVINDTTISAPGSTINKTLYAANANKNAKIEINVSLGTSQNWVAAGFNGCYATIGGNTYQFSSYTEAYTNPVSSVRVVINAPVAAGEAIALTLRNNSGQYTKTFVTDITIS